MHNVYRGFLTQAHGGLNKIFYGRSMAENIAAFKRICRSFITAKTSDLSRRNWEIKHLF